VALTNSTAGAVTMTYSYDSFGVSTGTTGSETNPYRYTGREIDARTALHYYRARYYAPNVGRFVSEDPVRFAGGYNFYAYVANKPIVFRDPMGLLPRAQHYIVSLMNWRRPPSDQSAKFGLAQSRRPMPTKMPSPDLLQR